MTAPAGGPGAPLLSVRDLSVSFSTQHGPIDAVKGISFDVFPGETVAIVGESGSGKSTTATAILRLLPSNGEITGGQVWFEGQDLTTLRPRAMSQIRGREIGYVPQDPMMSLNPVWSVGFQVREAVRANGLATSRRAVAARAVAVLKEAGLADAERRMRQFPHQFSGGMRQRVLIGIGLAADPRMLIADEPTSALDVTIQRIILDHIEDRTRELKTAVLLVTHDLGIAAERASTIIVMYQGRIVEAGPSIEILERPLHAYTKRLIAAAPSLASRRLNSSVVKVSRANKDQSDEVDLAQTARRRVEHVARAGEAPAIEVRNLTKVYTIRRGSFRREPLTAVDHASFLVPRGTTLALVGESGSGKSTLSRLVLGIEPPTSGEVFVDGRSVVGASAKDLFTLRSRMQPVFQDPYGSLDPMRSIGGIIAEPLDVHHVGDRTSRQERVKELLEEVALPGELVHRYPNELSGGQRQRVAIARALALKPDVVILDEAVSALDVIVQAQILQLLADLQAELGLTYLFITHDLAVVRVIADQVAVMEDGKIVESGTVDEIFTAPKQEYTRKLLEAIPGAGIHFKS
jgi:peptide/nickel transport system ATP-binding protein